MKRQNRKGFTIVELVIVIAVIAILAAVLIPTFAGLVAKANAAADQQAVRQMNQAIAMTGKEITDINTLIDTLDEQGYNSKKTLVPVSKGHTFYWDETTNKIILVDAENKVVFPTDATYDAEKCHSLEASIVYVDVDAADSDSLIDAVNGGHKDITLTTDITVSGLTSDKGTDIKIDLNGKTLTTSMADATKHQYALHVYGTVTLTNGTIDARGIKIYDGGKLILGEGVKVNHVDDNGGACLWVYEGAEVVVDGGEFIAAKGKNNYEYDPAVISNFGGKITINGGKFEATISHAYAINNFSGELVINGGEFNGYRGVVSANGGTVTINGGKFTVTGDTSDSWVAYPVYAENSNVVINAGEFAGGAKTFCVKSGCTGIITVATGVVVDGVATTEAKTVKA